MVGRWGVRARLLGRCKHVIASRGAPHRLVLMTGRSGVGKSRVAEWLAEVVHEDGQMLPLIARYGKEGFEDGVRGAIIRHYNFQMLDRIAIEASLLARWQVAPGDVAMRTWVAVAASWLQPFAPEAPSVGPSGLRAGLDRPELTSLVERFVLRTLAGGRPLLLVLDDLHAASREELDRLRRLHEFEPDQRLVIVATIGSEAHQNPFTRQLQRLRESLRGDLIEIEPMDHRTTCRLLRASLPLHPAAVNVAAQRSQGLPLLALQQMHAWARHDQFEFEHGVFRVPERVLAERTHFEAANRD